MKVINLQNEPAAKDYRGAGKAWAAISDDGHILALRYMGLAPTFCANDPEILAECGRVRRCATTERAARRKSDQAFAEYRTQCRAELAAMGNVISGMCSCWEFCI